MSHLSAPASPIIEFNDASKCFYLRDNDANPLKRVSRKILQRNPEIQRHWALRNINLAIQPGESIALIGVNGSGKSTLLKLITGISHITHGSMQVRGRVGGILDLGAGFHPDLTGFENIFLQATLLGLSRRQIWERLKSIEDFCELDKFLNTPIRHYSSGMFLRLAFSIAIHTDPDIFIIDEALAVGDGYFMWKCMKKLQEMKRQGKTLLYVSHTPEQVESLCERAIWIHEGRIHSDGEINEIIQQYHRFQFQHLLDGDPKRDRFELSAFIPYSRFGTGEITLHNVTITNRHGHTQRFFHPHEPLQVRIDAIAKQDMNDVAVYFILERPHRSVTFTDSTQRGYNFNLKKGKTTLTISVADLNLYPGPYTMTVGIGRAGEQQRIYDGHQKIYNFTIVEPETAKRQYSTGFLIHPVTIQQETLTAPN